MKKINQTDERYASVLSDAGFKAVLGDPDNKDLLISIINIILDGERVVHDLEYRNVELGADVTGKKGIRLDLFCRDEMGAGFIVEMQKARHNDHFFKRSVYYGARALSLQMKAGKREYDYQPIYVIGLMETRLSPQSFADGSFRDNKVISHYEFIERTDLIRGVPTISCKFVQLGNFTKTAQQCKTKEDQCLYIIKHSEFLSGMPFEAQTGVVDKLLDACEVAGFNEEKRIKYDNEKMSEIDYFYEMDCERAEGREEGLAQGRAEVAKAMLADGLDSSIVSKYSGLSVEQVEELKKGL